MVCTDYGEKEEKERKREFYQYVCLVNVIHNFWFGWVVFAVDVTHFIDRYVYIYHIYRSLSIWIHIKQPVYCIYYTDPNRIYIQEKKKKRKEGEL